MTEKIPCPVAGCDEVFDDEAAAIAHMKEKHQDEFAPATILPILPPGGGPDEPPRSVEALSLVPPGMLEALDARVDERIQAALVAERPQIQAAVKGAIEQVIAQARAAGLPIPGVTVNPAVPEGGVVPGSPVTPAGAQLMNWMMGQGQSSGMEDLAKTLTQARAISDVLNPPSIWDRVMQNAVLRSLGKAGLVTDAEVKELLEPPAKP